MAITPGGLVTSLFTKPVKMLLRWVVGPVVGLVAATALLGSGGTLVALIAIGAHYLYLTMRGGERDRTATGTDPSGVRYTDKFKVRVPKSPLHGQIAQGAQWVRNGAAVIAVLIAVWNAQSLPQRMASGLQTAGQQAASAGQVGGTPSAAPVTLSPTVTLACGDGYKVDLPLVPRVVVVIPARCESEWLVRPEDATFRIEAQVPGVTIRQHVEGGVVTGLRFTNQGDVAYLPLRLR